MLKSEGNGSRRRYKAPKSRHSGGASPEAGSARLIIRKAVLPMAGIGTRFLPATKAQPKEMLPIVDKPLVQYAVEEAAESGIKDFVFVIGPGKDSIQRHFGQSSDLEQLLAERKKNDLLDIVRAVSTLTERTSYVYQWKPEGLGDAILKCYQVIGEEFFAVLLSDDIIVDDKPCLKQLMEVHSCFKRSVLAVKEIPGEAISNYGVIKGKPLGNGVYRIDDMVEKPKASDAPSNLAIIGRYILSPTIFEHLDVTFPGAGGEIQLTDALRAMLKQEDIYAYAFPGKRYDAGDKMGFLAATVEMALQRPDLREDFLTYLQSLPDLKDGIVSASRHAHPRSRRT